MKYVRKTTLDAGITLEYIMRLFDKYNVKYTTNPDNVSKEFTVVVEFVDDIDSRTIATNQLGLMIIQEVLK